MEITHRDDLGDDLNAPKLPTEEWGYDLLSQVQTGDRVLHWKSGPNARIVGWSEVIGQPTTVPKYTWQPRGTSGRTLPAPRTSEGWVVPLGGLHKFQSPPTSQTLLPLMDELIALRDDLNSLHGTTYFPYYRYGGDQIRAQQAYLVKFPYQLFDIVPGIGSARLDAAATEFDDTDISEDYQPSGRQAPTGRTTRAQDPKLRAAIERRSLDVASEYYASVGGTNLRELGKPYDIAVTVDGVERHCEVKGSRMLIDTVELTINEVTHGQDCGYVDLIVVDGIEAKCDPKTGEYTTKGGRLRIWRDWSPNEDDLSAKRFAYVLPAG